MRVELGLGDSHGSVEVFVWQLWIDDCVAVVFEVGRLDATWNRLPAVKEEDFYADPLEKARYRSVA